MGRSEWRRGVAPGSASPLCVSGSHLLGKDRAKSGTGVSAVGVGSAAPRIVVLWLSQSLMKQFSEMILPGLHFFIQAGFECIHFGVNQGYIWTLESEKGFLE